MSGDLSPVTAEERQAALLRLDRMTCPVHHYDRVVHVAYAATLRSLLQEADERGWTRRDAEPEPGPGSVVYHATTGARGEIARVPVITRSGLGDLDGRWAYVRFDDGLTCWCPLADLLPERGVA